LRRQAQEFLERPFVARRAQIFEYSMTPDEKTLYDDVTAYLLEPQLYAFRGKQRQLLLIGFHRLMGSSIKALAPSLRKVAERLERLLRGVPDEGFTFMQDLDDEEDLGLAEADEENPGAPDPSKITKELQRVRDFIQRAETLPGDSKAEKLLDVMRIIGS